MIATRNASNVSTAHESSPPVTSHLNHIQQLADLSRNASVISTSSSSSSSSNPPAPIRPRPLRAFSNHSTRSASRARSPPASPSTPRPGRIPAAFKRYSRDTSPDAHHPEMLVGAGLTNRRLSAASTGGTNFRSLTSTPVDGQSSNRPPLHARSRSNSNAATKPKRGVSISDFDFGDVLGSGSYSMVVSAVHKPSHTVYAVKVIDKEHLKRERKEKYAYVEKNALTRLQQHPGIVRLHYALQDITSLYFVLDLAPNGELQSKIRKFGSLSLACTRFYTAQIIDTLQFMHKKGIIHRDMKPENILLDDHMRIKIVDFGSAKILDDTMPNPAATAHARTGSFVGSAIYASPELLLRTEAGPSADIWALGSIIFYSIVGSPPFKAMSDYLVFEKIKSLSYEFPEGVDTEAKDLIQKIFVLEPSERIQLQEMRSHPFFSTIDWETLWTSEAPPLEHGMIRNPQLDKPAPVWDDDDDEDEFSRVVDEDDDEDHRPWTGGLDGDDGLGEAEEDDPELERIRNRFGSITVHAVADEHARFVPATGSFELPIPAKTPSPPILGEPRMPRAAQSKGFVVVSRGQTSPYNENTPTASTPTGPPPINIAPGPRSTCSNTSSEGSPVDASIPIGPTPPSAGGSGNVVQSFFHRVFTGAGSRRGSNGSPQGRLARRFSAGSGSFSTKGSHSRSGSSSSSKTPLGDGSMRFGLDRWMSIFYPNEQLIHSSPVMTKAHTALLPTRKRILLLTDLPRLICVKESLMGGSGVIIKSEVIFTTKLTRPPRPSALSKITERSSEVRSDEPEVEENNVALESVASTTAEDDEGEDVDPKAAEPSAPVASEEGKGSITEASSTSPTSPLKSTAFSGVVPPPNLVESIDYKGEKSFSVRTPSKIYTYYVDSQAAASRWHKEIEEVKGRYAPL